MRRQAAAEAQRKFEGIWERANVPARHAQAKFDATRNVQATRARDTMLRAGFRCGAVWALVGPRGTGKTQAAVEVMREAARQAFGVYYTTAWAAFAAMKLAFDDGGDGGVARLTRVPLLVIDEAHVRMESAWEERVLTNLVDERYANLRTTVLVTNQQPEEAARTLGPSISDRAAEAGGILLVDGPSLRRVQR